MQRPTALVPISRADVAAAVRSFPIPKSIVRTSSAGEPAAWCDGDDRDLLHDRWEIRTTDPSKKRNGLHVVGFDAVVAPGGVRLSDDGLLADALTKRCACLAILNGASGRRRNTATSVFRFSYSFDWHVRFRLSLGLSTNSELRKEHWTLFLSRLESGDMLDLVPIDHRLQAFLSRSSETSPSLPPDVVGDQRRDGAVDVGAAEGAPAMSYLMVAAQLGVTATSVFRSQRVRAVLEREFGGAFPGGSGRRARDVDVDGDGDRGSDDDPDDADTGRSEWSVNQSTDAWRMLSTLSRRGALPHDPIGHHPSVDLRRNTDGARAARRPERNPTVNPPHFLAYLNAAATWMLDYSPHVLGAVETLRERLDTPGACPSRERAERRGVLSRGIDATLPPGMPRLWLCWSDPISGSPEHIEGRISLRAAVKHLMTAGLILLGGFGGLSVNEVLNLRAGCVSQPRRGLFVLRTAFDTGSPNEDGMPIPAMSALVVDVLGRLTAQTRERTEEPWLFRHAHHRHRDRRRPDTSSRFTSFPGDGYLRTFGEVNGLAEIDQESGGRLDGTQLRRAFAVCYYFAGPAASLDALCRFRRQFDPEATRTYVENQLRGRIGELKEQIDVRTRAHRRSASDTEARWLSGALDQLSELKARGGAFDEVRCEAHVHRMLGIVDRRDVPIGKGGAKLVREVDALKALVGAEVRLGSRANHPDAQREPLVRLLRFHALTHWIEPIPGNPAYCTCRPNDSSDLASAACLQQKAASRTPWIGDEAAAEGDVRPDYAYSGILTCFGCPHGAAFEENREVFAAERARVAESVDKAASPGARAASKAILDEFIATLGTAVAGNGAPE